MRGPNAAEYTPWNRTLYEHHSGGLGVERLTEERYEPGTGSWSYLRDYAVERDAAWFNRLSAEFPDQLAIQVMSPDPPTEIVSSGNRKTPEADPQDQRPLARLAAIALRRPTRDRHPLAPARIPAVLNRKKSSPYGS